METLPIEETQLNNRQEWYAYGASGNRVLLRDTSGGKTNITTYAFGLEEHSYNNSGNTGNTYYYSLSGRLLGQSDGTNTQFNLTDELGSVLATFNSTPGTASVLANQAYGPYGNKLYSAGTMGTNKGFTGQYNDPMGLDYDNARYYDPAVGRFVSADIVQGNVQGMDPYPDVGSNPETHNDPTGQSVCPDHGIFSSCLPDFGILIPKGPTPPDPGGLMEKGPTPSASWPARMEKGADSSVPGGLMEKGPTPPDPGGHIIKDPYPQDTGSQILANKLQPPSQQEEDYAKKRIYTSPGEDPNNPSAQK